MPRSIRIETARVFQPLLKPARDKGAWGGRGSGKSHFFAELLVEDALRFPGDAGEGLRTICAREVQKSLKDSAKHLIESKLRKLGLGEADGFKVFTDKIETPGDGLFIFQGLQDHTSDTIKSFEGFHRFWGEEAHSISGRSINLVRPTMRWENARLGMTSEMFWSWNPRRKSDAVDLMLRGEHLPTNAAVVRANWSDNPWFPSVLEQERQDCLRTQPEQYGHIWEGEYATVLQGAYFAKHIAEARKEGRIGRVPKDPTQQIRAFWDIGFNDATAIWVAQFVGREIRVLDYYEASGQPLAAHLDWLRIRGWGNALCVLPHDGAHGNTVTGTRFEDHVRAAGFPAETVANMGKGAAIRRIEAARKLFPAIWFNEETTSAGIEALGWYHEKRDEARNIGLGPDHDWSSHGCFHPDTKVLTRYGTQPICKLPETGEVLTPCGWKQYIAPRITKQNARLVEVVFTSGFTVKCTPDHLFLTEGGWKSAEHLQPNTVIQSTLTKSLSTLTEDFTVSGRAKTICRGAADGFTETFGNLLSARFPKVAISTTKTRTFSIIGWIISNASRHHSICPSPEISECVLRLDGFPLMLEARRQTGIEHQKAGFGTNVTLNGHKAGRNGNVRRGLASIAALSTWQLSAKAEMLASIVRKTAKWLRIEREASKTNGLLRIAHVKPLNETSDVWDITVPDGHWFSLENGAVVHNSDAFGLMCVSYEEPRQSIRKASGAYAGSGSWMG